MNPAVRPLEPRDFDAWLPLWDGYNALYRTVDITALTADRIVREILGGIALRRNGTSQQQKEEG